MVGLAKATFDRALSSSDAASSPDTSAEARAAFRFFDGGNGQLTVNGLRRVLTGLGETPLSARTSFPICLR